MHGNGNRQQTPNTVASTPSGSDVSMPNNNQKHFYFGTHGNGYSNQNYGTVMDMCMVVDHNIIICIMEDMYHNIMHIIIIYRHQYYLQLINL